MAFLQMPVPVRSELEAFEFVVELEKVNFKFSFNWNRRAQIWSMAISTTDGTALVAGLPLLMGGALIQRFPYPGLPLGDFLVLDTTGGMRDPTLDAFGSEILLLYREADTV